MNLSTEDTQLFYRLHWALLAYANRHLHIFPEDTAPKEKRFSTVGQVIDTDRRTHRCRDISRRPLPL